MSPEQSDMFTAEVRHLPGGETERLEKVAPTPEQKRDAALEDVKREDFWVVVRSHVCSNLVGQHLTGEEIREACEAWGITPHHHNAWGGLIGGMVRSGLLRRTMERRKMHGPKSNARRTDVYLVVGGRI